jgi:hypothetical protein
VSAVPKQQAVREKPGHAQQRHGTARRSPGLRVFDDLSLPETWEVLPGVPHTRADCPVTRPCPHLKCRYHLWLVEAESMPGRRWERAAPATDFHPWSNTTCALDVADQHKAGTAVEEVARMLGMSSRQVRRIVEKARKKLSGNPDAVDVLRKMVER